MSTTWILVANSSAAKLYANHGPRKGLVRVKDFEHPQCRSKVSDLVSDRPGHGVGGHGGAMVSSADPKQHEAEQFAAEIVRYLEEQHGRSAYSRLIVAAAPHFLGMLKGRIHNGVARMLTDTIEKDYIKIPEKELAGHLEKLVYV